MSNNTNNNNKGRFAAAKAKAMRHIDFLVDATTHCNYIEFIGCRGEDVFALQVYDSGIILSL